MAAVDLDPYKTLFLPYGTGALLVREDNHLKSTHSSVGDYIIRIAISVFRTHKDRMQMLPEDLEEAVEVVTLP